MDASPAILGLSVTGNRGPREDSGLMYLGMWKNNTSLFCSFASKKRSPNLWLQLRNLLFQWLPWKLMETLMDFVLPCMSQVPLLLLFPGFVTSAMHCQAAGPQIPDKPQVLISLTGLSSLGLQSRISLAWCMLGTAQPTC